MLGLTLRGRQAMRSSVRHARVTRHRRFALSSTWKVADTAYLLALPSRFFFLSISACCGRACKGQQCMRASVCNVRQACTCTLSHDASRNGSGNLVLNSPERRPPLFTERRLVAFVQHQPRGAFFCNAQVQERRLVRFWCVHISSNILSSFAMFKKYGFPGFESRHASAREEDSSRAVVHGCCRGHSSVSGSDDEDDSQDDHAEQPDHSGRWHDSAR